MMDVFKGLYFSNATDHVIWCVLGICASLYALYIEKRKHKDPKYVALCDINKSMSCSTVLTSKYSKGFGFMHYMVGEESMLNSPNCFVGIIFYSLQLIAGLLPYTWMDGILYYTSIVSCIGSAYLVYILVAKLKEVCLVCITTYCINAALLYLNYQRVSYARTL